MGPGGVTKTDIALCGIICHLPLCSGAAAQKRESVKDKKAFPTFIAQPQKEDRGRLYPTMLMLCEENNELVRSTHNWCDTREIPHKGDSHQ